MKARHELTAKVMGRATKAEIAARIEVIVPMILDGLRLREIRLLVAAKTTWGGQISEAQVKCYVTKAQVEIRSSSQIDYPGEVSRPPGCATNAPWRERSLPKTTRPTSPPTRGSASEQTTCRRTAKHQHTDRFAAARTTGWRLGSGPPPLKAASPVA